MCMAGNRYIAPTTDYRTDMKRTGYKDRKAYEAAVGKYTDLYPKMAPAYSKLGTTKFGTLGDFKRQKERQAHFENFMKDEYKANNPGFRYRSVEQDTAPQTRSASGSSGRSPGRSRMRISRG